MLLVSFSSRNAFPSSEPLKTPDTNGRKYEEKTFFWKRERRSLKAPKKRLEVFVMCLGQFDAIDFHNER
jgi:hypothetical protein